QEDQVDLGEEDCGSVGPEHPSRPHTLSTAVRWREPKANQPSKDLLRLHSQRHVKENQGQRKRRK
ncbi:Hypothetical predicted protein, partial [Marmota monax]